MELCRIESKRVFEVIVVLENGRVKINLADVHCTSNLDKYIYIYIYIYIIKRFKMKICEICRYMYYRCGWSKSVDCFLLFVSAGRARSPGKAFNGLYFYISNVLLTTIFFKIYSFLINGIILTLSLPPPQRLMSKAQYLQNADDRYPFLLLEIPLKSPLP